MSPRRWWRKIWRIGLGSVVILAGIAMCVLPGPGLLTIVAGLAIMADEFPPAHRLLMWMRARFEAVKDAVVDRRANTAGRGEEVDETG